MQTQTDNTYVSTNAELEKLVTSNVAIIAEYAFHNPFSINGPFGTMKLTISSNYSNKDEAFGSIKINTLWGLGTSTNLNFSGDNNFNSSTGYTNIDAPAKGTIIIMPNPPKFIKPQVSIVLDPGFKKGTLSVEGFFNHFEIKATSINYTKA